MLAQALTRLALSDQGFTRDGPRADVEYRDLGWAAASGGMIGAKHIRAVLPFEVETGWHWHDMSAHFVYVLQGCIEFRYACVNEAVMGSAGFLFSIPAGVAHNVVDRSDDLELIEINLPAGYGTWALRAEPGTADGPLE
jgi:mannose-6-phosphate isomerase-like protein (cupin superfamily)